MGASWKLGHYAVQERMNWANSGGHCPLRSSTVPRGVCWTSSNLLSGR